jgi:hypothetical protein
MFKAQNLEALRQSVKNTLTVSVPLIQISRLFSICFESLNLKSSKNRI